jgi:hypothetical protein
MPCSRTGRVLRNVGLFRFNVADLRLHTPPRPNRHSGFNRRMA